MEEAWELAPVMTLSNQLTSGLDGPSYFRENVPDAPPSFETDFSDKFEKSKNKVVYFSALSALVGVFNFETATVFSGVHLGGLTDFRLEWILWTVASVLIVNMAFRFMDERRRFERYKNEVGKFRSEFSYVVGRIEGLSRELVSLLKDDQQRIRQARGKFEVKVKLFKSDVKSQELEPNIEDRLVSDIEYMRLRVSDEVERIESRSRGVFVSASMLPSSIEKFQKDNKPVEKFVGFGKFRFLLFDVIMQVSLFTFATLIHFFPSLSSQLLQITQQSATELPL